MSKDNVISADKMMNKAKGPVWHTKQKEQGIIPKNLTVIDREATWCTSKADGSDLFREFERQRQMNLITYCRVNMDKTPDRRKMIRFMKKPQHKKIYRERSYRVEPMQGLVKDIFELNQCWMRGNEHNCWLFAAMGLTIQMHQLQAFKEGKSTWNIKEQVLG